MDSWCDVRAFRGALKAELKGPVASDDLTLGVYATDASIYQVKPVAVALPRDEDDVRAAVGCAQRFSVPCIPRGGGTSLGGQAIGPGLVLDFSTFMNRCLSVDVENRTARVQPGCVLDELNAALATHGLHFAPDPATSSRATVGGMIGNNSSGTRSILYGITKDHVKALRLLLSDGTVVELAELSEAEYLKRSGGEGSSSREAQILSGVRALIAQHRGEIAARFPKVMRRVQGYNLDSFLEPPPWNLAKLIVGSEGTLGIVLEATLNLEPIPRARSLVVAHFHEILQAVGTVKRILEHGPSAVEILDSDVLSRARKNLSTRPLCDFLSGDPQAVLICEFLGDTPSEAAGKAENLAADLRAQRRGYAWPVFRSAEEQAKVWTVRKSGLGLMLGMKGERKPIAVIEDSCVPIEVLPEYVEHILSFARRRGLTIAMYAHASVGTIHLRPVLNLKDRRDIEHMKAISEFSLEQVLRYGGSLSGEHGDGRIRSPLLERFFGPEVYGALKEVKKLFDPSGLMNPGIIVNPAPQDRNLRYGPQYRTVPHSTCFHFREDGSFEAAVEMCTGVGACRQTLEGTMCPSFRATREEFHSTRARANALRLAISGQLGHQGVAHVRLQEVFDLCLACKACKAECPSNVDGARLKSEFLSRYHESHGATLREKLIAAQPRLARAAAGWKAPFVNRLQKSIVFRKFLELALGFDSRRTLPSFARVPLHVWFERNRLSSPPGARRVVLFDDTYLSYHETKVGKAAVELLRSCGYEVVLARAGCCQRPRISHGFLKEAAAEGEKTLRRLDEYIRAGLPVVVCEPGCASALTDDLPDLIADEALSRRIKEHVFLIDNFLAGELQSGRLKCRFSSPYKEILIHAHCHRKALFGSTAMKQILARIPTVTVREIDSGCCGMAGSFGYEKEHYEISLQVGEDRLFPAIRDRPEGAVVVACGFSCRHQITHATGVVPLHWVETLRGVNGESAKGGGL